MQDGRVRYLLHTQPDRRSVLIAASALLFIRVIPGLFDLALGIDRWGYGYCLCGVDDRPLPAVPARQGTSISRARLNPL